MKKGIITAMVLMSLLTAACAQLSFDSVTIEPLYIEAGDDVEIRVKYHQGMVMREIFSTKTRDGENIPLRSAHQGYYRASISAKDEASQRYVLIKRGIRDIGNMFAGETWSSTFDVNIAPDAPATTYTLVFRVENIMDGLPPETVLSRDITLDVRGRPKFTVSGQSRLFAGTPNIFKVNIENVGAATARHVTARLNATHPITVLGPATQYAGQMNANEEYTLEYILYVDSQADAKAYDIPIRVTYVDRNEAEGVFTDNIGIKVSNEPDIIVKLDDADGLAEGMEGKVGILIVNRGFAEAKFVSVEVVGSQHYELESNGQAYIGNIPSDDYETEDFTIRFKEGAAGQIPLLVRLTHTQEGEKRVLDFEVPISIMSKQQYMQEHMPKDSGQWMLTAVLAVPAIIAGYIGIWLMFKVSGSVTGYMDRKLFRRR